MPEPIIATSPIPEVIFLPQPKSQWPLVALVIFVILLVAAGAAYAGIQIGKKQVTPGSILTFQPTPIPAIPTVTESSPIPINDPTADWKTYTDTKYKFQFKYPSEWPVESHDVPDFPTNRIITLGKTSDLIVSVNKTDLDQNCLSKRRTYESGGNQASSEIVGGVTGWKFALSGGQNPKMDLVCFENRGLIYEVNYAYNTLRSVSEQLGQFDQILSTFKFTE